MPDTDKNAPAPFTGKVAAVYGKLSLALFVIMLIISGICYKERILFSDSANYLFHIINDQAPIIGANRYGTALAQYIPLMGVALYLPLTALMILFSVSMHVICIITAALLVYKFRQPALAVLLGLYYTMFVSESFYYLNNEGIPLLLLAFAIFFMMAEKKVSPAINLPVSAALFAFAISTHPLVIPAIVYLWFFFLNDKERWPLPKMQTYIFTVVVLILAFMKFHHGKNHGYDSGPIERVTQFDPQKISTIHTAPQFMFFLKSCITNYWILTILFLAGLWGLYRAKKYFLVLMTVSFTLGYFVLICIVFWSQHGLRFYHEIEYMPLAVICVTPFIYFVLPRLDKKVGLLILIAIYSIRLIYIVSDARIFTQRLALMEKIYDKVKEKKYTKLIVTDLDSKTDSALLLSWAAPWECMMLSKLDNEVPQRTFFYASADEASKCAQAGADTLLGCWEKRTKAKMNSNYFMFDTTAKYQVISFAELMK